jgi:toxin ParE1/3/4
VRLRWSELAAAHIENIHDFVARDKPAAALATIDVLIQAVERLTEHPKLGRKADHGTRKLIHPPFVIVYRILEDVISIEAVFHGNRRY